jgi:predicted nucleic acid-binding protein
VQRPKEILVQDACILIDLMDVGLIEEFFRLGYHVITTEYVVFEITEEYQRQMIANMIERSLLEITEVNDDLVNDLNSRYPGLTLADCSVLTLATTTGGKVLTADGALRRTCQNQGVRVGGFLWVVKQLVLCNLIPAEKGLQALETYQIVNMRPAPKNEILKLREELNGLIT